MNLSQICNEQSRLLDGSYRRGLDLEAHRWRRCAKVSEEAGEVIEALLGLSGENPRKGITHDISDVRKELLDVAFAALCAVAHLDGNKGDVIEDLDTHARGVYARLARAMLAPVAPSVGKAGEGGGRRLPEQPAP